jgi:hypothetical protein
VSTGTIDGKVVLLYRQVDSSIAVACSDPTMAQGLIPNGKVADGHKESWNKFNGIDPDQRREYVKGHLSIPAYAKTNGQTFSNRKQCKKPIKALNVSEEFFTSVGLVLTYTETIYRSFRSVRLAISIKYGTTR